MDDQINERLTAIEDGLARIEAQLGDLKLEVKGNYNELERRIGNVEDDVRRVQNAIDRIDR